VIAEMVGAEPSVNLAILHPMVFLAGQSRDAVFLEFGDSEALQTGHWALGFGNPDGPEKFFAPGVFVARPTRDCYQALLSAFYMQLAMVAHPQAYGGPVINLAGKVVGVLGPRTALPGGGSEPKTGIEMAMPSKIVVGLYESIRQSRSFASPWFGFSVMGRAEVATARGVEAFDAMVKPRTGIMIEDVFRPSPAAAAGIEPGDFLVRFDATYIFTPVDFQKCLYLAGVGKKVTLELFRDGETLRKELTIERRPKEATPR
jgi:serine protease Do